MITTTRRAALAVSWRDLVRWWLRQPRLWVSLCCVVIGVGLTVGDRKPWWTGIVGLVLFWLGAATLRFYFDDHFPEWTARRVAWREERFRAEVTRILSRYEQEVSVRHRAPALEPPALEPPALEPPALEGLEIAPERPPTAPSTADPHPVSAVVRTAPRRRSGHRHRAQSRRKRARRRRR